MIISILFRLLLTWLGFEIGFLNVFLFENNRYTSPPPTTRHSHLGLKNISTASLQTVKTPPNERLGYDIKQSDGEAGCSCENLGECGVSLHCNCSQVHSDTECYTAVIQIQADSNTQGTPLFRYELFIINFWLRFFDNF